MSSLASSEIHRRAVKNAHARPCPSVCTTPTGSRAASTSTFRRRHAGARATSVRVSRTTFTVEFRGPAVSAGEIDTRELAAQLIALSDALENAGETLSEGRLQVRSRVVANFEQGSFIYHLATETTLLEAAKQALLGDDVEMGLNAATLVSLLFGAGAATIIGLTALIKKLRGGEPKRIIEVGSNLTILTQDDEELSVDSRVFRLYRKRSVRRAMADFSRPLIKDGVDEIKISSPGQTLDSIEKQDAAFFQELPPEDQEPSQTLETQGLFGIVAPVFKPGNKWRLSTAAGEAYVGIEDRAFLKRVQDGEESFSAGDILKAKYRQDMYRTPGGWIGEMTITEVIGHTPGGRREPQGALNFEAGPDPPKKKKKRKKK